MSGARATDRGAVRSWDDLARNAAQRRQGEGEAEEVRQLLGLEVDGSPYAVAVESVREIVRVRPITPIPRVSSHVRGVISLRGEIVQVIDLRLRLGLAPTESTKATRIVVVHTEDGRVAGVLVDAVHEVMRVSEDAIGPSAAPDSRGCVEALCTRGSQFVSLLDLGRLLDIDGDA